MNRKTTMIAALSVLVPTAFTASAQPAGHGADDGRDHTGPDHVHYIDGPRKDAPIPRPGVELRFGEYALVVTDPQNDFLSADGVAWGVVGQNVTENGTVENLERLFMAAKGAGARVFISPHYYYPHDHNWEFEGALERLMHDIGMFDRTGPLDTSSIDGSGADWLERYKPYINDGKTVVVGPHKVFGPESNDLALQLRKAGVSQVVLAGMSANLCVESHMRDLVEEGFEVVIVSDATAAAKLPGYDGFEAAFVNYRMIASDVWSTDDAVERIAAAEGHLVNVSGASLVGLSGFDPVGFFQDEYPINGSPMIRAEFGGATYLFANESNRDAFLANPTRYVPQYGGFCAYGVSLGMLLPVDITTAQVRNGKLYLNVNAEIREQFDADFLGSIGRADSNWPALFDEFAE